MWQPIFPVEILQILGCLSLLLALPEALEETCSVVFAGWYLFDLKIIIFPQAVNAWAGWLMKTLLNKLLKTPLGILCLLLNSCWLPQFTIWLSPKYTSCGDIVTNISHASSMPVMVKVFQYFQSKINHQSYCIKCACTNLGLMWKDTNS